LATTLIGRGTGYDVIGGLHMILPYIGLVVAFLAGASARSIVEVVKANKGLHSAIFTALTFILGYAAVIIR
jgi:hypothetical protein